jgi:hypothetical protein
MLRQATAWTFWLRVSLWSLLTFRGRFDWQEFLRRLEHESEFRAYASWEEARQSLGWAGLTADGKKWLFGVCGSGIPLLGNSAMRHELFHAAQDLKTGLFTRQPWLPRSCLAEVSAHVWGGPLLASFALCVIIALGCLAYWIAALILSMIF